jgi:hypothetical protein
MSSAPKLTILTTMASTDSTNSTNSTNSPAAQCREHLKRKAFLEQRRKWQMECYKDDDESTELLLPAVELSEVAKLHQLFRIRTRLQCQYKEYRDIRQDEHERPKQEAEGVILRSRAESDSESRESGSSSISEVEE